MVTFSFAGIEMVGMTAGETANPKKKSFPKPSMNYRCESFFFLHRRACGDHVHLPVVGGVAELEPLRSGVQQCGHQAAADIINFVVLTAAASACNSSLFTTGRMLFSLTIGTKNSVLKPFGKLSRRQVLRMQSWGLRR
nr:hypothetical protein [Lacticaseibacillus camelliae]